MKRKLKILFFVLSLIIIQVLMMGCERRDLVDIPTSSVYIKVNWEDELKAKTQYFYVAVFPQDPKEEIITSFIESDGGYVNVPRGKFDVLIYSYDYESILVRLTDRFTTSYATTSNAKPNSISKLFFNSGAKINSETDSLFFTGTYEALDIEYADYQYMIEISPKNIIKHFEVRLKIKNPGSIYDISGFVSGLSGSYLLGRKDLANDTVSIKTRMHLDNGFLVLKFNTFGLVPNTTHILNIDAVLLNSETRSFGYDISREMRRIPNGGIIILDSVITVPIVTGGGMGGTVVGWGNEEGVEIIM
ncbi:MAG: DUF5119 domain-containing protein [Bacteroidales bacterium]|nr:DUF5119 domain-containing protein [Bacteroidales bacterium]